MSSVVVKTMDRVGDTITIYVVSDYARTAYCGAARLEAMGYESEGMDEDELFFYSVVSTKSKDIGEILYDLYRVSNCVYALFVIELNKGEYIFVKPNDLKKLFDPFCRYYYLLNKDEHISMTPEDLWELAYMYRYYSLFGENCEEGYKDLSDYRYCVAYEDLLYDELDELKPGIEEIWKDDEEKVQEDIQGL